MNFSNTNIHIYIISDKNTCSHCTKKFSSKQNLQDHLTRCGKKPTLLFCPHRSIFTSKLNKSAFHKHQICKQRETYNKRTSGLSKLEATGDEMICLCSKTYILVNKGATKFSCKGINKNRFCNTHSIVLKTKESHSVIKGFQVEG